METPIDMIEVINDFNINRNIESLLIFLNKFYINYKRCKYCNLPIVYYDSFIRPKAKTLKGKSFLSIKKIREYEYSLCVCEKCLTDKYPEYQNKNKGRIFNQMNKYTKFAFDIKDEDFEYQKNLYVLTTEDNLIRKYGKEEGEIRWVSYKKKQAETNTFEYKKEKYNWSKEQFEEYNKSRAITIDNLIKKHGKIKGNKIWDDYIVQQKMTKSKDYFIQKYSEEKWDELCKSKAHTLVNYIKWYGDEEAIKK